jgi:phosphoglycerate-specific signal transduction histidine kinase
VHSLEGIIGYLTTIVQSFQKNTAKSLAEVYSNIDQLAAIASSASVQNATGASINLDSNLDSAGVQELAHLSESFAREVTGLVQNLRRVTEEMRAGLTPFRPEAAQSSQQSEATQSSQQGVAGKNNQQSGEFQSYKSNLRESNRSGGF